MIKHDFHMHTSFSSDSDSDMRNMILMAISDGLEAICFTDHFDYDFPENPDGFDYLVDFPAYEKACATYKEEFQDKIKILCGLEVGVQPHLGPYLDQFYKDHGNEFDFILSSCHLVKRIDPYEPELFQKYSGEEVLTYYFETLLENIEVFPHYQSLAHLDYVYRYYPKPRPEFPYIKYREIIDEILKKNIAMNKALEVNTAGLRSGLPFPNPHLAILKRYHELGGEMITIGSDAHRPVHIAHDFRYISDYLNEAGFKYYTIFEKQQPKFIKL